jgi:hypothetical protein
MSDFIAHRNASALTYNASDVRYAILGRPAYEVVDLVDLI